MDEKNPSDQQEEAAETTQVDASVADPKQQKLAEELEKAKKDYLYLAAEFENYKRNMIKERSDLRKFGAERLIVDLLTVLDVFETALKSELTPETLASFHKGVQMTANELKLVLQRHGVEEVPAEGPFNPSVHEAISSEATEEIPEGHIARVFKKPYKMHEKVIRPGQVIVATKPKA